MRKLTILFALLCASMMSWAAIDWSGYSWLGNGSGNAAYTDAMKIDLPSGFGVVNLQSSFGTEAGIYITTPSDVGLTCDLGDGKFAVQGTGMLLYLSAFTLKETPVTVTSGGTDYIVTVYWKDGAEGGGGSTPAPGEKFIAANASIDHTYFANWEWAQENNSTASYDNTTGEITVHIDNDKNIQWYAQVHFALGFVYTAGKYYDFSIKFHSDKAVNQVTLKTNDDNALFYQDQNVNIPANEDYVFTKNDVLGVAGNNIFVFDFGHASANTNITISEISIIEKDAPSTPAVVEPYCRKATGHLGNAEFGDANGRILLTLRKTSASSVLVKVEPNNNGIDYFDIMHIELNGVAQEMGSVGGPALSNMEFEYTGLASLDFTLNILWHNHNWADVNGRWTTNAIAVTEAELCEETTELSIGSEYCCYYGDQTRSGSIYATLTWETNEDGDVVITIGDGPGESNTTYRGNGLGDNLNGFTVLSGTGFATSEPASDYFTRVYGGSGSKTYILQKKGGITLPSPAKIHFQGKAFEWKCTEEGNAYTNPTFEYTYGKICSQLDAPANVAIDANNILTFDAVAGADSYMAYVSLGGVEKYSQAVASGDELTYTALVTGDYIINVVASGAGKVDSDPSADVVWHLEAAPIVLGNSEYCEHNMSSGNTEAAFTWETDANGNIVITISEVLSGSNDPAHFRANAFKDGIKVGASKESLSTYFNIPATIAGADHSQNSLTYTLIDPANAPALGEKIYYHGVVEYRTSENTDAWPTLDFEWTYGTVCSGKAVSATSNNNTMGSVVVQKAGVDVTNVGAGDEVSFIATVADPALYRFVNWTKGGVEVSTEATYVATITETTNLVANFDYIRNTYCQYTVTSNASAVTGKKLYITLGSIGGGQYQIKFEGSAEAPLTALNNANYTINWVTTDIDNGQNMSGQDVPFPNARWSFDPTGYGSATAVFGIADGHTWEDIYVWNHSIFFATAGGELGYSGFPDRYHIAWTETCVDAEKPVMTSASLASTTSSSAIINVAATDDHVVDAYHVVDGTNSIDLTIPAAVQITVPGLVGGTTYNFVITALDACGKESENNVPVEVAMAATVTAPTTAPTAPTWPADQVISFYSDTYTAPNTWNFRAPWGGSTAYEQVEIASNNVIHYSALDYVGWIYEAGGSPYNAINMEKLHLDIWVADDCTIGIVPIYGGDGLTTDDNKRKKPALTGQQWNSIDLDLATDYAGLNLASIFQFKFDQATTTEFWVDNVYFYRTTELVDDEAPTNVTASVAETGFYSVKITAQAEDNMGSVNFSVMNGAVEVATGAAVSGVATTITVNGLTPGTNYSFDVIAKDDKPNAAAPVAVAATTKAIPASAPTPDFSGKLVIPVFTDATTCAVTGIHSGGWGEATIHEWMNLSANDMVFYVQNLNWAGWHSWGADIDATGMQYLHVDVYSIGATSVNVTPISHDPTHEGSSTIALTPNAWTSYDVPLSNYDAANIEWNKIFQFKFMNPAGGNELMIDNVYFWKAPDYTRDDDWMAPGELGTVCIPQGAVATGGDLYTLEGRDSNGKIVFATVPDNRMTPGVPYLFQATSNAMNFFYTDEAAVADPVNTGAMKGSFTNYTLTEGLENIYYFNGHALWSAAALTELPVVQYRAYVKMDEVDPIDPASTSNPAPGRRYIIMDVHGQNATTGFGEVQGDDVQCTKMLINGQIFILRGEKMYDTTGRLVK